MRDIDDVEQAKNDGEAESDEGNDQPPYQSVHCEQKQRIHHVTMRSRAQADIVLAQVSNHRRIEASAHQANPGWGRGMSVYRSGWDHVPVDIEFFRRQAER